MDDPEDVRVLKARLARAEARNAELSRLLIRANERVVELERRSRALGTRARELTIRARSLVGRRLPALARLYRRLR